MISLLQSSLCSRSHFVSEGERMLESTRLVAMGTWRRQDQGLDQLRTDESQ